MNTETLGGRLAMLGLLVCLAVIPAADAADPPPATPDALVRSVTGELLHALKTRHQTIARDPQTLVPLMQQIVVPHFDFELMAREVLGRYWRRASDDQRTRFLAAFKQLLVDDYAAVFRRYTNQSVKLLPNRSQPINGQALVSTEVVGPGQQPVRVRYRLRRTDGDWRIDDVEVEGVSLLLTYRDSFEDQVQREGLDALISAIEDKNHSFHLTTGAPG
jgi:phospholipid transport system substrate-binding protein